MIAQILIQVGMILDESPIVDKSRLFAKLLTCNVRLEVGTAHRCGVVKRF